jgi:hypothetical protein
MPKTVSVSLTGPELWDVLDLLENALEVRDRDDEGLEKIRLLNERLKPFMAMFTEEELHGED